MRLKNFESYTFFPGQHWSHTWERQHELITRFANMLYDKEIMVASPLGLINHNPFSVDFFRRISSYRKQRDEKDNLNPVLPNMKMCDLRHIPFHTDMLGKINYRLMKKEVAMSNDNFFWSTYMNPEIYEFFRRSSFKVYDLAERRSTNPALNKKIKAWERRAVEEADLVVVDNHATFNDYATLNKNLVYIPQGVNTDTFYIANNCPEREYIGYIGNLHFAIDYPYFENLILKNPDEKFLIIGGILESEGKKIVKMKNVTYIPQIPKSKLNDYLAKMKIGLIPYLVNDHTIGVYPTKLFEYLSSGVPVITTGLPEVIQYADDDYMRIMDQPGALSGLNFNMNKASELVKNNTWDCRWHKYIKTLEKCLM